MGVLTPGGPRGGGGRETFRHTESVSPRFFSHPFPTVYTESDRVDGDIVSFNQIIMFLTSRGACLTGNKRPEINDVLADYTYVLH